MRISKDKPVGATTGKELLLLLARRDCAVKKTMHRLVVAEDERDETGALPAGHRVTWGALWNAEQMPVYRDVCGYGDGRPQD